MASGYAESVNRRLVSPLEIDDLDIRRALFEKYPHWDTLSMLASMGRSVDRGRQVHQHKYEFWEETNWYKINATASAKVATFKGQAVTNSASTVYVQLAAADHSRGGKSSYAKKHQTVYLSSKVYAYVDDVDRSTDSAHIVKLVRVDSTDDLNASITAGTTKLMFFSNAQGEESGIQESSATEMVKYGNFLQTFRVDQKTTDHEEPVAKWFDAVNKVNAYTTITAIESAMTFRAQEEMAIILGRLSSGVTQVNGNGDTVDVQTTEGILPTTEKYGINLQNSTNTLDDFETVILALQSKFGDTEYILDCGVKRCFKLDKFAVDFQKTNQTDIGFSVGGSGKQAISIGLKSFTYGGYTFRFKKSELFSHPTSLGDSAFDFSDMALGLPMGSTKTRVGSETSEVPNIQIAYMKPPVAAQHQRGTFAVFEHGAMASHGATSGIMHRVVTHYSIKGAELHSRHKFLKLFGDTVA